MKQKPKLVKCENCEKLKRDMNRIRRAFEQAVDDNRKLTQQLNELRNDLKNVRRLDRSGRGNGGAFFDEIEAKYVYTPPFIKTYEQCEGRNLPNKSVDLLINDKFNYHYSSQVFNRVYVGAAALLRRCLKTPIFETFFREISKKLTSFNLFPLRKKTQVDSEIFHILGRGDGVYRFKHNAAH